MGLTEDQWHDADIVIKVMMLIQCTVFLFLYIRSYVETKKKMNNGVTLYLKLIINSSILFVFVYTIRYIISLATAIVTEQGGYDGGYVAFDHGMKDLLFIAGHSLFYAIMILRLYFVFRGSVYALSRRANICFLTAWSIITITNIIYFIVLRNGNNDSANAAFFFILAWLDIGLGAALIIVFTQKLTQMGIDSREDQPATSSEMSKQTATSAGSLASAQSDTPQNVPANSDDSDSDEMYKDHGNENDEEQENENDTNAVVEQQMSNLTRAKTELTKTQNILVFAAAKYALLCGLTILFICLQFMCQAIYNLTQTVNYDIELVLSLWFVLVLFGEYFTIYLSFPNTTHQYEAVCNPLHKLFEGIFRANMMNKLQRKEAEEKNQIRQVCCCKLIRTFDD